MSIWQLLMWKVFGCEYVSFQYGYSNKIRRVHKMPNGRKYVKYDGVKYEKENGRYDSEAREWTWLTPKKEDKVEVLTEKVDKGPQI